jgi:hypothetical protein
VFSLEHYFARISLAAVREAFNNACPDKEVTCRVDSTPAGELCGTEVFVCDRCSSRERERMK